MTISGKETAPQSPTRLLVIEDEHDIAELIQLNLADEQHQVQTVGDGLEGYQLANSQTWDLIILDLQLPNLDGLEICRLLRANNNYVPILMLTSRNTELDRVLGLEVGADDYLSKPFSVLELAARVKALLRRVHLLTQTNESNSGAMTRGSLHIDRSRHTVTVGGKPLELTAKEFDLLWFFASNPGKAFTRLELLKEVWGYGHEGYEHTVNSHINRLRGKLEPDPTNPTFVHTLWGVGYRFEVAQ